MKQATLTESEAAEALYGRKTGTVSEVQPIHAAEYRRAPGYRCTCPDGGWPADPRCPQHGEHPHPF
jgi:hypothetical protein